MNIFNKICLGVFGTTMILILIVIGILLGPALLIWSVNVLFGTCIGFTFQTWLASVILLGLVNITINLNNK